jgi:hypothetical protein
VPEENINEPNETGNENQGERGSVGDVLVQLLKMLGILVAVAVLIVVIGFGLLVGFCALSARH